MKVEEIILHLERTDGTGKDMLYRMAQLQPFLLPKLKELQAKADAGAYLVKHIQQFHVEKALTKHEVLYAKRDIESYVKEKIAEQLIRHIAIKEDNYIDRSCRTETIGNDKYIIHGATMRLISPEVLEYYKFQMKKASSIL